MRYLLIAGLAALLLGCTRTVYVDRIIEVPVEVPIPCAVVVPAKPVYPMALLEKGLPDGPIILSLDEETELRDRVESRLRNLLDTCKNTGVLDGR